MTGILRLDRFFTHTPAELLAEYFKRQNLVLDIKALRSKNWQTVWDTIEAKQREACRSDFLDMEDLNSQKGFDAIREALMFFIPQEAERKILLEKLGEYKNHTARAMHVFLNYPEAFRQACDFNVIDATGSHWKTRHGIGNHTIQKDESTIRKLGDTISKYFREKQARGEYCEVRYLCRGEKHFFIADLSNYSEMASEWEDGTKTERSRKPSFSIYFAYAPKMGTLDVYQYRLGHLQLTMHRLFCRIILGLDDLPKLPEDPDYALQNLLNAPPEFVCHPETGVEFMELVSLTLEDTSTPGLRLTISGKGKDEKHGIHAAMNAWLPKDKGNRFEVISARFRAKVSLSGHPPKTKQFTLNTYSLASLGYEEIDERIHQVLMDSDIEQVKETKDTLAHA